MMRDRQTNKQVTFMDDKGTGGEEQKGNGETDKQIRKQAYPHRQTKHTQRCSTQ